MTTALQLADPQQLVRAARSQLATASSVPGVDDYLRASIDWCLGLALAPDQQLALAQLAFAHAADSWRFALQAATGRRMAADIEDAQFAGASWQHWPFNVYAHGYGHLKQLGAQALAAPGGMSGENARRLEFLQRLWLDAASPAHYLPTNPELLEQTQTEGGANLLRGAQFLLEDAARAIAGGSASGAGQFRVGAQVAITPGKVVMRNELAELIQYSPQCEGVHAEPILITPAWIMKYYILDLSPHNSLVNYLVSRGHTVFMLSWKNPTAADRNLGMDDYLRLGLRAGLDAVHAIVPGQRIHAVGYCIGGTLLTIGAAALARAGDTRIGSITLFAAQTDFSEPGELSLFISPGQLATLEAQMQRDGVLKSESMGAAFALLRGNDLIWAPAVNQYLRGRRPQLNDLMAWNADGTRMPCRMHSEYLKRLYLHNELAAGRFTVARRNGGSQAAHAADVRGRHRNRSRRALAFGIQDPHLDALGRLQLRADQWRPQRRHHQRAREPQAPPPRAALERRGSGRQSRTVHGGGRTAGRILVADLAAMARHAFDPRRLPPTADGQRRRRLSAAMRRARGLRPRLTPGLARPAARPPRSATGRAALPACRSRRG